MDACRFLSGSAACGHTAICWPRQNDDSGAFLFPFPFPFPIPFPKCESGTGSGTGRGTGSDGFNNCLVDDLARGFIPLDLACSCALDYLANQTLSPSQSGAVMGYATAADLLAELRALRLLEPSQLDQAARIDAPAADPKALASQLVERRWLTPLQASVLLQGRGTELVLGSYVILARLGEGGMGQVFKA